MGGKNRVSTVAAFCSVALAAIVIILIPTPEVPYDGLYRPYAPAWGLLFLAAMILLWRITCTPLAWHLLLLWGLLFSLAVGSLSVQWGYVYGFHDPWAHVGNIRFEVFDLAQTPYPAFHIWNTIVGGITGIPGTTILRYSALLAIIVGGLGLAALLRVLPVSRRASQRAFIAGLPALFLSFIPRPFTLGWPFVTLIAWAVFTPLDSRRAVAFLMIVGVGLTALHPQIPFLASAFLFAAFIVQLIRPSLPTSFQDTDLPFAARQLASLIGVYAIVVGGYFLLLSDFGQRAFNRLVEIIFEGSGGGDVVTSPDGSGGGDVVTSPEKSTPDSAGGNVQSSNIPTASGVERRARKVSQLRRVIQQPSLLPELLARLSYILVLGVITMVSTLERLRAHRFGSAAVTVFVAAGLYGVFYIFADIILNNALIGARRIIQVLPLILIPGIAHALRRRSVGIRSLAAVVALLILVSGLAVAYPSNFQGSNVKTATDMQVAGVDWVGNHAYNVSVTGTGMTFWILEGQFGKSRIFELAPTDEPPKVYVTRRNGFSWQVQNPTGLIIVDGFSRAQARQEVSESGDTTPLRDLETMPIRYSKLYTNGGTDIYGNRSVAGG